MSRTRLAAAAGVAALTLGATAAVADDVDDSQIVTIEVTAAPRSITVGAPLANLTVVAGAAASDSTTSTLAYNAGDTAAQITVELDADGNGLAGTSLTGSILASGMAGDQGSPATEVALSENAATGSAAAAAIVNAIAADEIVTGKTVTYTLGGTATAFPGGEALSTVNRTVHLTFTITDE